MWRNSYTNPWTFVRTSGFVILQWFGIWAELLAERTMIASSLEMFGLDMLKHVGLVVCWVGAHQAGPRAPVRTTDLGPNCCFHIIWEKNLVRASVCQVCYDLRVPGQGLFTSRVNAGTDLEFYCLRLSCILAGCDFAVCELLKHF